MSTILEQLRDRGARPMPRIASVGRQSRRNGTGQTLGNTKGTVQDDWRIPFSHRVILQALRNLKEEGHLPSSIHDPDDAKYAHTIHSGMVSILVQSQGHTTDRLVSFEVAFSREQSRTIFPFTDAKFGDTLAFFDHINNESDAKTLTSILRPGTPMADALGIYRTNKIDHEELQRKEEAANNRLMYEQARIKAENTTTAVVNGRIMNIPHSYNEMVEREKQAQLRKQFVRQVARMIVTHNYTIASLAEQGIEVPSTLLSDVNEAVAKMKNSIKLRKQRAIAKKELEIRFQISMLEKERNQK